MLRDIARDLAGEKPLPTPTLDERLAIMLRHFELSVDLYNERSAVVLFRKWLPRYFAGLPIGRQNLVALLQISDINEWRERVPEVWSYLDTA